jgi:hypothetical protein
MSTNTKDLSTINLDLPTTRILLAESDPLEMLRITSNTDVEFRDRIKIVKSYNELVVSIAKEPPQLLMLGRIDKTNYFEVCKDCHKFWPDLPIVLISRQDVINTSFYEVVKSYGVTDIISNDFTKLNHLLQTLYLGQNLTDRPPPNPIGTGKMLLTGLDEIVIFSNTYFGALAQGNYWRKAHARVAEKFTFIQKWSADHFGKLSCDDSILEQALTEKDICILRLWVQLFIEECERVIVDYGAILSNSDVSPLAKDLLNKP